jgi:hypothetical protein
MAITCFMARFGKRIRAPESDENSGYFRSCFFEKIIKLWSAGYGARAFLPASCSYLFRASAFHLK